MKPMSLYVCCLFVCFLAAGVCADVRNGGFEISEPNEGDMFESPVDWVCDNYTSVDTVFFPSLTPRAGSSEAWELDFDIGLLPYDGNSFVILSTSDMEPNPQSSKISQQVEFLEGHKFTGAYFFGTYDYPSFNDFGRISLNLVGSPDPNIILVEIAVPDVGRYSSMEGWETFEHTFTAEDAGIYDLVISVTDVGDNTYASYFMVDGLEVCRVPPYGDVNLDCKVDLSDFNFLARDWMLLEPNSVPDPNYFRQYETDFNGNGQVEEGDLEYMGWFWLFTE